MAMEQAKYTLKDFTLTLDSGVIENKTELSIETQPEFIERNVGMTGVNVYNGRKPPTVSLKIINDSNFQFDDSTIVEGYPVGTFTLTSDNDSDVSTIANLVSAFPVDGATKKWVWGKKSTSMSPDNEIQTTVEIKLNCVNWLS